MKKILTRVLCLALSLIFITSATACREQCEHEWGEWNVVTEATCQVEGTKERVCALCKEKETASYTGGHSGDIYTVEETKHYKTCTTCGAKFDEAEHVYEKGVCKCGKTAIFDLPDFIVEVEEGREAKVLFLADTQIIDSSQKRSEDRLNAGSTAAWEPQNMEELCFKYIRATVEKSNPDLIILLGDNVYGEFDDAGTSLPKLIEVMESFEIPWGLVYGNHDNETAKGAKWQNAQYEAAEHCIFKKGETDGNGNYTIAIKQGNEITRMFYLMDTNDCLNATDPDENGVLSDVKGFTKKQVDWLYETMDAMEIANGMNPVKSTLCFHVPSYEYILANQQYTDKDALKYTFGKPNNPVPNNDDFGSKMLGQKSDYFKGKSSNGLTFLGILQEFKVDTVFCGHEHVINTSISYKGIRFTYGLKTGKYDSHTSDELGGTQMTFDKNGYYVKHLYYDQNVQTKMDALREAK